MTRSEDELLIQLVRECPFLYDSSDPGYHNNRDKDLAWQQISEKFDSMSVATCRKRWIALRDSFRKSYKKRLAQSRQSSRISRPWKYESIMSFIVPHIGDRAHASSLSPEPDGTLDSDSHSLADSATDGYPPDLSSALNQHDSIDETANSSVHTAPETSQSGHTKAHRRASANKLLQGAGSAFQDNLEQLNRHFSLGEPRSDRDALTSFFKAMEDSVRTFSVLNQIEVKGKIAALVNEYEVKNYNEVQANANSQTNVTQTFRLKLET